MMEKVKKFNMGQKQCEGCGEWVDKKEKKCLKCAEPFAYRVKETTIVKVSTVVFALLTVFFFVVAALWSTGVTKVEDINEENNFSILKIKGTVIDTPDYYPNAYDDSGTMRIWLNDTSGEIQVYFDEITTKTLIKNGEIPELGDTVEVMGRVSYSKDSDTMKIADIGISKRGLSVSIDTAGNDEEVLPYRSLSVENENNLEILKNVYTRLLIPDIAGKGKDTYEDGKKVLVNGTVVSDLTNYSTAYVLTICDVSSGEKLIVYVPKDIVELSGIELYSEDDVIYNMLAGSEVSILGSLTYYESAYGSQYSKWELIPSSLGKAKKVSGRYCFEIGKEGSGFSVDMLMSNPDIYKGEDVLIQGARLTEIDGKDYIEDVGGQQQLLLFCYSGIGDIPSGAIVDVKGEFTNYQGTWEIKIYESEDIQEVS